MSFVVPSNRLLSKTRLASPRPSAKKLIQRAKLSVRAQDSKAEQGGRKPWDLGRFVSTVSFFNQDGLRKNIQGAVNGLANVISGGKQASNMQDIPVASKAAAADPLNPVIDVPIDGVILVSGATGGVGKRVVAKLLTAGKHVRALVRDVTKAQELLASLPAGPGAKLELVTADITQRRTLLPEFFRGVRAVVSCTAVKVQPKEGDDSQRSKYMQGIKFFDPEIVGDTPETVELLGIKNLLDACAAHVGLEAGLPILKGDQTAVTWGALDDVVMGGVSKSGVQSVPGAGENGETAMVFKGNVSTDNSGGFASVRTKNIDPALDLGAYEGVELRVKGNGLRYKILMRPDDFWDGVGYSYSFDTQPGGQWETIRIPFRAFFPTFRAKRVQDAPPLDATHVSSVQLMLSKFEYDGELNPHFKEGDFELPIAYIKAYLPESAPLSPKFVHVSSAGVTRPSRPGINVDMEPPAVKLNATLGGILDFKLEGEDAIRRSGLPCAVLRPCALTEEPRGMPLEIDQGDVIKGKIGREDVAELCLALLSEPAATNCTFEIKSQVPFSQPWEVDAANPPAVRDWHAVLKAAGLRPGVTGKTVNGVYTGKEPEAAQPAASSK